MDTSIRTRRVARTALLALVGTLPLTGCVEQRRYDNAAETARTMEARNQELLQDKHQAVQLADRKQQRIDQLEAENKALTDQVALLSGQVQGFGNQLASFDEMVRGFNIGRLDPTADKALRELAEKYPGMITYDPDRGMLRFSSDLTFGSGSDSVNPQASTSLQQLAGVLNSEAAAYNLDIVGHTDSQPIGASRNRFPTNRHLSVARAISVTNAIAGYGVNAARIKTSGWGEFMPLVQNNPGGNTPQNRRVEIFLMPSSTKHQAVPAAANTATMTPPKPAAAPVREFPMK